MVRVVCVLEYELRITGRIDSVGWTANRIRGALGKSLRKVACATQASRCDGCPVRDVCAYGLCFEPVATQDGRFQAAGQEIPRPYVIRAGDPEPQGTVRFQLVLLGRAAALVPVFVLAVHDWQEPGMGLGRVEQYLDNVECIHPLTNERAQVFARDQGVLRNAWEPVGQDDIIRSVRDFPDGSLRVSFVTPTRLRRKGRDLQCPEFAALISSLLRRAEGLREYHGLEFEVPDPQSLVRSSDNVRLADWQGGRASRHRYSYRQKQAMEFEGLVGDALYEGDLAVFLPLLRLAEIIHVGKGAVFGLGQLKIGATA